MDRCPLTVMAEGAVVSHGLVPMRPKLVQSSRGKSGGGSGMLTTTGELASGKSSDHLNWAWKSSALGMVLGDGTEVRRGNTYEQVESVRG
jgi:hypothetical protein